MVSVPAPAIKGKAKGNIEVALDPSSSVFLKISLLSIISNPIINITIAPATANDLTSTPKSPNIFSPPSKNNNINTPDAIVAFPASIFLPCSFKLITIGIFPTISITENRINETDKIALKSNISS